MSSSCKKIEVVVKAAVGQPDKLGDCPFSQRVLMTCEIKDIVYDVKYVDLDKKPDWTPTRSLSLQLSRQITLQWASEVWQFKCPILESTAYEHSLQFLKASPEGRVPLIKIDDKWIADSDVIVKVLEDAYPCPPLATLGLTCWGQGIFPAAMAFFKSKNPSDGTEKVLVCELDSINDHLRKNGPYIDGKYLTSADVALAPKLYIIQIALAHYKNWSNIEPFYPALSWYMKLMFNLPAFRKTCAPPAVVVKGWAKHWT